MKRLNSHVSWYDFCHLPPVPVATVTWLYYIQSPCRSRLHLSLMVSLVCGRGRRLSRSHVVILTRLFFIETTNTQWWDQPQCQRGRDVSVKWNHDREVGLFRSQFTIALFYRLVTSNSFQSAAGLSPLDRSRQSVFMWSNAHHIRIERGSRLSEYHLIYY